MSAVLATANPRRIKASHRRRRKVASGQSVQRYYDPAVGRFLSVDPVTANPDTGANFNRFWYANGNPYKFIDPDGRLGCAATKIESNCQSGNGAAMAQVATSAKSIGPIGRFDGGGASRSSNNRSATTESRSPSNAGAGEDAKTILNATDLGLTAQGIMAPKARGKFVIADLGLSKWIGATAEELKAARAFNAIGQKIGIITLGLGVSDFGSAFKAGNKFGMFEAGTGITFGVAGFSGPGAPGAFLYGGVSALVNVPPVHAVTITPIADLACSASGNC